MKTTWKRWISVLLSVAMVLTMAVPAMAADSETGGRYTVAPFPTREGADAKLANEHRASGAAEGTKETRHYTDSDIVRASIVLTKGATLDFYSAEGIADNSRAIRYRAGLVDAQNALAKKISAQVLNGAELDVVWNLTLAANIISANIPYGTMEKIKAMPEVRNVVIERQYHPVRMDRGGAQPDMSTSNSMIGSSLAWAAGYTGRGTTIAIIDTGIDLDHQSFDEGAFLASVGENAALVTEADISADWDQLNASDFADAAGAYRNAKIPFAVNYIDESLDVTHEHDMEGEHGSHVAGTAAANRYIPDGNGGYTEALDSVFVQGVAPDAQLLIMKVFGQGGGAYDSDYMAALEDAITLGVDAINMSLGSSTAGLAANDPVYDNIVNKLINSGTVLTISSGNNSYWAENTSYGNLYADDVNYATGGSPGTYAYGLTVASVENTGITGFSIETEGGKIFYSDSTDQNYEPFATLAGEQEYVFSDTIGFQERDEQKGIDEFDYFAELGSEVLSGRIAICYRGDSTFSEKANAAAAQGAIGVIIVNNQPSAINMILDDYTYSAPVILVSKTDGEMYLWNEGTKAAAGDSGAYYCTGTLTVGAQIDTAQLGGDPVMSDFSSWGVPGDLSLKPEITAPGGSIYSVNGFHMDKDGNEAGGHDQYENMNGTSMASPQVAGMAALVAQYIRENDLTTQTGYSARQLTTSLLMGTAVPLLEYDKAYEDYFYYSVMQQGAGLADVNAAINAHSYIMMNADATASYNDGKVKAELGDDPDRTGSYSFSFTLNNLTKEERRYSVLLDLFTQYKDGGLNLTETDYLYADVTINGTAIQASSSMPEKDSVMVAVPANGSVQVQVEISNLSVFYDYGTGQWIEGFVKLIESATEEGAAGDYLSIPLLGYYGSWSEPRMTDVGTVLDYAYTYLADYGGYSYVEFPESYYEGLNFEALDWDTIPYLTDAFEYGIIHDNGDFIPGAFVNQVFLVMKEGRDWNEMLIGFNPLDSEMPYYIDPARAAVKSSDVISGFEYTLIRNAGNRLFTVTDADGQVLYSREYGPDYAACFTQSADGGRWDLVSALQGIDYSVPADMDGEWLNFNFTFAPEYYIRNGETRWDLLSPNATLTNGAYVDNTLPTAEITFENGTLTIDALDNLFVAGVSLYDAADYLHDGDPFDLILSEDWEKENSIQQKGDGISFAFENFDHNTHPQFIVEIVDYASNISTYIINLDPDNTTISGVEISEKQVGALVGRTFTLKAMVITPGVDDRVTWESSDPSVVTVDPENTEVLATNNVNLEAVGPGTATITVRSVADETLYDTCTVTVGEIKTEFRGFVWDEEGTKWYAGVDVHEIPAYEKIAEVQEPIVAAAVAADNTVYAASLDEDTGAACLYTLDPDTGVLTMVDELDVPMADMAYSPTLDALVGGIISGDHVYLSCYMLDGSGQKVFDQNIPYVVGIAYAFTGTVYMSQENQVFNEKSDSMREIQADYFFAVDLYGDLYLLAISENGFLWVDAYIRWIGDSVDYTVFQSLYFDGQYVYWSRFSYRENNVDMIVCDLTEYGGLTVYNYGSYDDAVWPVGALFEYTGSPEPGPTPVPGPRPYLPLIPGTGFSLPISWLPFEGIDPIIPIMPVIPTDPTQPQPYIPLPTDPNPKSGSSTQPTEPTSPVIGNTDPQDKGLPFTDVDPASEIYETIKFVYDKGLMNGVSDTLFDLYGNLTRGMIVSILYRMEGSPEVTYTGRFSDVAKDDWFAAGVEWAASVGIANGYDNGKFGPNDPVTREQLAAFLYRYANWKGCEIKTGDFNADDKAKISEYALDAVKWAVVNDMLWIDDDNVRPTETAKRWEIAVAMKALIENVLK